MMYIDSDGVAHHYGYEEGTKKTVLISTARGTDFSATLQQYGVYAMLGWEDLGHILGAGKENFEWA